MFRALAAVAVLTVGISGCAKIEAITGFRVTQQTIGIAVTASATAEKAAAPILKLPICSEGQKVIIDGCITAKLGDQIVTDVGKMRAARASLWAAAKADPNGVGLVDAYNAFKAATNSVQADIGAPTT